MGNLENLQSMGMGNVYVDGDLISTHLTAIGYAGTMIVNGNVYVHTRLWLANQNSRISIRGNLYNGMDARVASTIGLAGSNNGGALLDLRGDYVQAHGLNNAGFVTTFGARVQLSGNSSQRIVFPAGGRVHFNNLHIRNQPSNYTVSNGLNTYSFANAIANPQENPKIWNNLFHDIEEITIPNVPPPDDGYEEIDLPNNTGMLAWPANSGEVTLWFGIVDDLFDGVHNGIDIQDEIGAPVYSISHGVVTDIYNDPFYGNVVAIDFLYYGEHKQAKYCHLSTIDVIVGESVTKGQTIGIMGSDSRVDKGLLELRLYEGGIAIDPFPLMVRPDVDLSFLLYPMAFSFSENGMGRMRLMTNNQHDRYMGNRYLEEGEVYL